MKLAQVYFIGAALLLTLMWAGGVSIYNLAIAFLLLFLNAAFQLWVRGNVNWNDKIDYDTMRRKISPLAYKLISTIGLLVAVLFVSRIAPGN